jgi:quercetin dioxygenase-like cupin family protein
MKNHYLFLVFFTFLASCKTGPKTTKPHEHIQANNQDSSTLKMIQVHQAEGEIWKIFGLEILGKIDSAETNGQYSVIETRTPPNAGPPMHVHSREDELFYVLQGHYRFYCGADSSEAVQGDLVHLPRGIAHGFKNVGDSLGVMINTISPGGFENFFRQVSLLSESGPMQPEEVKILAEKYGLRFIPSRK